MRWALTLSVISLFGCQSGQAQDAPSATPVVKAAKVATSAAPKVKAPAKVAASAAPETVKAPTTAPSIAQPPSTAVDLFACADDRDCVLVPTIRGHAKGIPDPAKDECEAYCFAAVNHKGEATWREAVRTVGPKIRCNKKFAKCPSAAQHRVQCVLGQCQATRR